MNNTPAENDPQTIGPEYLSADGSTLYSTVYEGHSFIIVAVRCREFGWRVTNPRARFTRQHVAQMLSDNRWTQV